MKKKIEQILNQLLEHYPKLKGCEESVERAFDILRNCYINGGKVLVCGNGGSASDSEHIVGELMKGFILKREIREEDVEKIKTLFPEEYSYLSGHLQGALPAISLVSQSAISSAYINDIAADMVFAQQVYGYAKKGDVLLGLSTSGNSRNVVNAIKIAKSIGIQTIGLTGQGGGVMKELCDVTITVPAQETYQVQELHLPVYHAVCAMLEEEFFASTK